MKQHIEFVESLPADQRIDWNNVSIEKLRDMGRYVATLRMVAEYLRRVRASRLLVRKIAKKLKGATPHERKMFCMAVNPRWRKRFVK